MNPDSTTTTPALDGNSVTPLPDAKAVFARMKEAVDAFQAERADIQSQLGAKDCDATRKQIALSGMLHLEHETSVEFNTPTAEEIAGPMLDYIHARESLANQLADNPHIGGCSVNSYAERLVILFLHWFGLAPEPKQFGKGNLKALLATELPNTSLRDRMSPIQRERYNAVRNVIPPDYATLRNRTYLAFQSVMSKPPVKRGRKKVPRQFTVDDCLFWIHDDGRNTYRNLMQHSQNFYDTTKSVPKSIAQTMVRPTIEELLDCNQELPELLQRELDGRHLENYCGISYGDDDGSATGAQSRSKVIRNEPLQGDYFGDRRLFVLTVEEPFSESFKDWILDKFDQDAAFMPGVHGREGSYVRFASTTDNPAVFTVGKQSYYAGQRATEVEEKLLDVANKLRAFQAEMIRTKLSEKYPDKYTSAVTADIPHRSNAVHSVVSNKGYKRHADFSHILCMTDKEFRENVTFPDGTRLPTRGELQVITFVITNFPGCCCRIDWIDKRTGKVVFSVTTNGNCLHWQIFSINVSFEHLVVRISGVTLPTNYYRLIVTVRLTPDPVICKRRVDWGVKMDLTAVNNPQLVDNYNQHHVITRSRNCLTPDENKKRPAPPDAARDHKRQKGALIDLKSKELRDTFPQMDRDKFQKLGSYRPNRSLSVNLPAWNIFSSRPFVSAFLQKKVLVRTTDHTNLVGENSSVSIDTLIRINGKFPIPGDTVSMSAIAKTCHMNWNSMCKDFISRYDPLAKVFLPHETGKNWSETYEQARTCIDKWNDDGRVGEIYQKSEISNFAVDTENAGMLKSHGSSGNRRTQGQYAINLKSAHKEDPSQFTEHAQSIDNPYNRSLLHIMSRRGIVLVVAPLNAFDDNAKQLSHTGYVYGYYHIGSIENSYLTEKQFNDMFKGKSKKLKELCAFMMEPNYLMRLFPVFTGDDYRLMMEENRRIDAGMSPTFTTVTISAAKGQTHNVRLEQDEAEKHVYHINYNELRRNYMDTDKWRELLPEGHSDSSDKTEAFLVRRDLQGRTPFRLDIKGAIDLAILISAAGAMRFLGKSLEKGTAIPLAMWALGSILMHFPFPMPMRTYDLIPLFLRDTAIDAGVLEADSDTRRELDWDRSVDRNLFRVTLFQAIVLRHFGRVRHYRTYQAWVLKRHKKTVPAVPTPETLHFFLEFLENIKSVCDENSMSDWWTAQHDGQIPDVLRRHSHAVNFLSNLADALSDDDGPVMAALRAAATSTTSSDTRQDCLDIVVKELLVKCLHGSEYKPDKDELPKLYFMAHQSLFDNEELWKDMCGPRTPANCHPGAKGTAGLLSVLRGATASARDSILRKIQKLEAEQIAELNNRTDVELRAFGCVRRRVGGHMCIVNALNGREPDCGDGEHFPCKIAMLLACLHSSRSCSDQPKASKTHCFPVRPMEGEQPFFADPRLHNIMKMIVESFASLVEDGDLHLPHVAMTALDEEWVDSLDERLGAFQDLEECAANTSKPQTQASQRAKKA